MNDQNQSGKARTSKGRGKGCLLWLGANLAIVLGLALVGYIYESMAEASDARTYPPPGQLVDVGGYRLHINCTGSGSPTVVIDAGHAESSASWGWVQPEVARTTRVCTYDRAGMGWSEASPYPRTARQFAKELHTLLANANEPGPYVLVGHSLGGYSVRVYAHDYPDEVSGLVLIDVQKLPAPDVATPQPAPKPGGNSLPALLARVGLVRLLTDPLGSIRNLPPEEKQTYQPYSVAPRSVQTVVDEFIGMAEGGMQARAVTTLGDLPLIVLTARLDNDASWQERQAELLQLSSNSQQIFADQSGHSIHIEQPEAAIAAILQMVHQIRPTVRK
jgi:pimeloyl-ACP methyl ester carboxylesterase